LGERRGAGIFLVKKKEEILFPKYPERGKIK
jgi:hypothetical protein